MEKRLPIFLFIILLLFYGCVSSPKEEGRIDSVNRLANRAAEETLKLLADRNSGTLAVYYFTHQGEESPISDVLIGRITTELANKVSAEKLPLQIVTRQNLVAIASELSFQLSDFADKESQLSIGKQLGADIILTGNITALEKGYQLWAQVIEVERGTVMGGFSLDFMPEKDFEARLAADKESLSELLVLKEEKTTIGGKATSTVIMENFDNSALRVQVSHREDSYGQRVISASARVKPAPGMSYDGSTCLESNFSAQLDRGYNEKDWSESGLSFYFPIKTDWRPEKYDGLHFRLKTEGFSLLSVHLLQERDEEIDLFYLPLTIEEGVWNTFKVPFYNFYGYDFGKKLNPAKPVTIELVVDYEANCLQQNFRSGDQVNGALFIDDLGFFTVKGKDDPAVIATFNDDINRMVIQTELLETYIFTRYIYSEEGEEEACIKELVPGIRKQKVSSSYPEEEGGRFLNISVDMEVSNAFSDFLQNHPDYEAYLSLKCRSGKSWKGFSAFQFRIRSDELESGSLEIQYRTSESEEEWFHSDLLVSPFWSLISLPFTALKSEGGTLADMKRINQEPMLYFNFPLSKGKLLELAKKGTIRFSLDFDDFLLK